MTRFRAVLILLLLWSGVAAARPLPPEDVPEPLRLWIPWSLFGQEASLCPLLHDSGERRCLWPGPLHLALNAEGGTFKQEWDAYWEGWLPLPGDGDHWPQEVKLDDAPAVVVVREGRPAVWVGAGQRRLAGRFGWERLPDSLPVAPEIGIVRLEVGGVVVPLPRIEEDGRVWLSGGAQPAAADDERLGLQVFRKVIDEQPLQLVTRLQLDIGGRQREVVLSGGLPPEFIPLRLESPLPARVEPDGGLRLQLRPGTWTVELTSRHHGDTTALSIPPPAAPWPEEEVWVFDARNHLRLVEIEGPPVVAPGQTNLPKEWGGLPAFRMTAAERFALKVVRRGDPQPEPDRLGIERNLWLDFDGGGYSLRDRITGTLSRQWRLDAAPALQLGQVEVDGQPQFITRGPDSSDSGVELRRGAVNLRAEGRFEGNRAAPPASGWRHDFQQASAVLHLPPGWRLFSATGSDNTPDTWLQRWTLLDLFLVLLLTVAAGKLWGWRWGGAALPALALIWHEPDAPQFVWLSLLAAIALLRVLPEGRLRLAALWWQRFSLLALAVIALPFLVEQIRVGLFPQIERPWQEIGSTGAAGGGGQFDGTAASVAQVPSALPASPPPPMFAQEAAPQELQGVIPEAEEMQRMDRPAPMKAAPKPGRGQANLAESMMRPQQAMTRKVPSYRSDPKQVIQTGQGIPEWGWNQIRFSWNGPVQEGQSLRLILLSPSENLALALVRVALVLLLAWRMIGGAGGGWRIPGQSAANPAGPAPAAAALLALLCLSPLVPSGQVEAAEFPDAEMLEVLRSRLLEPPECLPRCAGIARMEIRAVPEALEVELEVHSAAHTAIPLPVDPRQWQPKEISLDGNLGSGLLTLGGRRLWMELRPGTHKVLLSGPPPAAERLEIPLPLAPHNVASQLHGWTLEGVRDNGVPEAQLQLRRQRAEGEAAPALTLEPASLPPFARVERVLRLDLDWRVETRVVRLSPPEVAIVLRVPLLEGESVVSDTPRVADGAALVHLPAGASELVWNSTLEHRDEILLAAPDDRAWVESWQADISPIWRVALSGIPVVHHKDSQSQWLPEWRPWPGEQVRLKVEKPEGVPGRTLTIDRSRLTLKPGERATEAELEFSLRSSQGDRHTLTLPEGAELQTVTLNGVAQPIRAEGRLVTLPVNPGRQEVRLVWRMGEGLANRFVTPQVDLGAPSVNGSVQVSLGSDRWVLLLGGPALGPAVLFWGWLLLLLFIAAGLSRVPLTPLRLHHWLLLGVGLSQSSPETALAVAGWLLALGWRREMNLEIGKARFNWIQIGLVLLTLLALAALVEAVNNGLLGQPRMQISGNGSHAGQLNWYQDRNGDRLPTAWVISVPLYVYHLLMLAWALWLAAALVGWLQWAWKCWSSGGFWRRIEFSTPKSVKRGKVESRPAPAPAPEEELTIEAPVGGEWPR